MSETSTTKSETDTPRAAFATIRFAGDNLIPDQITELLLVRPTQAYKKGAVYSGGPKSQRLKGRTGVWYFSTDKVVASPRLDDHLNYLLRVLWPAQDKIERLVAIRNLIAKRGLKANVTLFWHGHAKAKRPSVHPVWSEFFKLLPADIQTDFDVDEEPEHRVA